MTPTPHGDENGSGEGNQLLRRYALAAILLRQFTPTRSRAFLSRGARSARTSRWPSGNGSSQVAP